MSNVMLQPDNLGLLNKSRARSVPLLEEKDTHNYRLWGCAIIGLLLGLTIYSMVVGAVVTDTVFAGLRGGTYFLVMGALAVAVYALGLLGTYGMYRRILTVYGVAAIVMAMLMFIGFVSVIVGVSTVTEERFVRSCFDALSAEYENGAKLLPTTGGEPGTSGTPVAMCAACCTFDAGDFPGSPANMYSTIHGHIRQVLEHDYGLTGLKDTIEKCAPDAAYYCFCDPALAMLGDADAVNFIHTYYNNYTKVKVSDETGTTGDTWTNQCIEAVNKTKAPSTIVSNEFFLPTQCTSYYELASGPAVALSVFGLFTALLLLASTVLSFKLARMPGMV